MSFFQDISPRRAIGEFLRSLREPIQHRWRYMLMAAAVPLILFSPFITQEFIAAPPRPDILYFESWAEGRSDAEIIAGNEEAARQKAEAEALIAQRVQVRRDAYKSFGRAFGMDVDKMEADAKAEDARIAAEQEARRAVVRAQLEAQRAASAANPAR